MKHLKISCSELNGIVNVPSSKSLSHRSIISASLSYGKSEILNYTPSIDVDATIDAMRSLGANIIKDDNRLIIKGKYPFDFNDSKINCFESGSTLRFLIPIALSAPPENGITFVGEGRLPNRPLDVYFDIFNKLGIGYEKESNNLPLKIKGQLVSGEYAVDGSISSQFISGLLFALPLLKGDSKITIKSNLESIPYIDMTLDILKRYSIDVYNNGYKEFIIPGDQIYKSTDYFIEGDYSQAAFLLAGGVLSGKVKCMGLTLNSLQGDRVIVDVIKKMGGKITEEDGNLIAEKSQLRAITFDAKDAPDLVPIISVLAAFANGRSKITGAKRLRLKECDRLEAVYVNLKRMGCNITQLDDGLIIEGNESLLGGEIETFNDHRIAMAFAIAALKCKNPIIIDNKNCIDKSYPNFWNDFYSLGGVMEDVL